MNDEILYGVGGMMLGLLSSSAFQSSNSECISTPTQSPYTVPTPTMEDYLLFKEWGVQEERKIKDFWNANLVSDGTNIYSVIFWIGIDKNIMTLEIKKIYPSYQEIANLKEQGNLTTQGDIIVIATDKISMYIDTKNYTVHTVALSPNIDIVQRGKPFKFNDGNDAIVVPYNSYLNGMEFPGTTTGNIGGIQLSGFGVLERLNWNFYEYELKGYRWIAFSTDNNILCGLLSKWGLYQDGGVWYNNTYYKLKYLDISVLSRTPEGYIGNERVIAVVTNGITENILHMNLDRISTGINGNRTYYNMIVYFDGIITGNGYAWQDSSII